MQENDTEPEENSRGAYGGCRASKGANKGKGLKVLRKAIKNRFGSSDNDDEDYCPHCGRQL